MKFLIQGTINHNWPKAILFYGDKKIQIGICWGIRPNKNTQFQQYLDTFKQNCHIVLHESIRRNLEMEITSWSSISYFTCYVSPNFDIRKSGNSLTTAEITHKLSSGKWDKSALASSVSTYALSELVYASPCCKWSYQRTWTWKISASVIGP
jgi:hypothetical protein